MTVLCALLVYNGKIMYVRERECVCVCVCVCVSVKQNVSRFSKGCVHSMQMCVQMCTQVQSTFDFVS